LKTGKTPQTKKTFAPLVQRLTQKKYHSEKTEWYFQTCLVLRLKEHE
jgi:hypothetical protein